MDLKAVRDPGLLFYGPPHFRLCLSIVFAGVSQPPCFPPFLSPT